MALTPKMLALMLGAKEPSRASLKRMVSQMREEGETEVKKKPRPKPKPSPY